MWQDYCYPDNLYFQTPLLPIQALQLAFNERADAIVNFGASGAERRTKWDKYTDISQLFFWHFPTYDFFGPDESRYSRTIFHNIFMIAPAFYNHIANDGSRWSQSSLLATLQSMGENLEYVQYFEENEFNINRFRQAYLLLNLLKIIDCSSAYNFTCQTSSFFRSGPREITRAEFIEQIEQNIESHAFPSGSQSHFCSYYSKYDAFVAIGRSVAYNISIGNTLYLSQGIHPPEIKLTTDVYKGGPFTSVFPSDGDGMTNGLILGENGPLYPDSNGIIFKANLNTFDLSLTGLSSCRGFQIKAWEARKDISDLYEFYDNVDNYHV